MENPEFELTEQEIEAMADLQAEAEALLAPLNAQKLGMLRMICKQRQIPQNARYRLSDDGKKLIPVEA